MLRRILFIISIFFAANFLLAQQEYEVSVTYVSVWVKATDDKGNPVEGLKQEDFQIFEDNVPVPITCFDEVKISEAEAAAQKAPEQNVETAERFVLYLDLLNTTPREYLGIKPGLMQFLDDLSKRNTEVMVAGLLPTGKLGIFAPFTKEFGKLRNLLDRAPANAGRDTQTESRHRDLEHIMEGAGADPIDALRAGYSAARNYGKADQQVSEFTLHALESFAQHLIDQDFAGHLIILYVSGGFSSDPGREYFDEVDDLAKGSVEEEEMLTYSSERNFNFDFKQELQKSIGKMNRLNVTISTLDTQGMGSAADKRESLQQVADETGGISFGNSQNFKEGLKSILKDFEHQYVICYSPPAKQKSGYKKIKVISKKPDVNLRYRQGYSD
ncbi:MAG TPA: VWA domain-containing protein [Acidobacteriota bacterium]